MMAKTLSSNTFTCVKKYKSVNIHFYCWFSLTSSIAMFFNENKRKRLHNNRVKFLEDLVGAPTWPPFLCLGALTWRSWRHVKTENISSRATLRRFSRLHIIAFCPKHPKWDQHPKFTPLSETTSIPPLFIWESSPTRAPPFHIATLHQRDNSSMSLIHLAGPGQLLSSALTSSLHLLNSCWPLSESLASHSFRARSDLHGVLHLHPLRTNSGVIRHAWSPTVTFSLSRIPFNNFGVSRL